jgi:hypothetical protein
MVHQSDASVETFQLNVLISETYQHDLACDRCLCPQHDRFSSQFHLGDERQRRKLFQDLNR